MSHSQKMVQHLDQGGDDDSRISDDSVYNKSTDDEGVSRHRNHVSFGEVGLSAASQEQDSPKSSRYSSHLVSMDEDDFSAPLQKQDSMISTSQVTVTNLPDDFTDVSI